MIIRDLFFASGSTEATKIKITAKVCHLYHAELDFYSASLLKQQSAGRRVAPLGHIILIPSQPVFALSP
jgi:hypothetical protein